MPTATPKAILNKTKSNLLIINKLKFIHHENEKIFDRHFVSGCDNIGCRGFMQESNPEHIVEQHFSECQDLCCPADTYLKDFKKKMQTTAKDGNETLSLEEAAWHLASLANFEFANANVECDDVRFDTLYAQVNITNGVVLLSDLGLAYESISASIDKFYNSLALDNKHFRFINASVSGNGEIILSLITTFNKGSKDLNDNCWFFEDMWDAYDSCYKYFNDNLSYPASTVGKTKLQTALNLYESHQVVSAPSPNLVYYTPTSDTTFYYRDNIDPYGSSNYLNSRLFANNTYLNKDIKPIICYLFDSALGKGYETCPSGECVVSWQIRYFEEEPFKEYHEKLWKEHYTLTVCYGLKHTTDTLSGQIGE